MSKQYEWRFAIWIIGLLSLLLTSCAGSSGYLPGEGGLRPDEQLSPAEEPALAAETIREIDLATYFGDREGTAVFLDREGQMVVYNPELADTPVSPCSSFKILSTLMILETGVVDPQEKLLWDGTGWRFAAWNQDIALAEAFQSSCVWYYRQAIDRIGPEYVQQRLNDWGYGNRDISQWEGSGYNNIATADGFWIESSLLVSPQEQVRALKNVFQDDGAAAEPVMALKEIMRDDSYAGRGTLYGKTGSGRGGWYVGMLEDGGDLFDLADGGPLYFAVRLSEQDGAGGAVAKEIVLAILGA